MTVLKVDNKNELFVIIKIVRNSKTTKYLLNTFVCKKNN